MPSLRASSLVRVQFEVAHDKDEMTDTPPPAEPRRAATDSRRRRLLPKILIAVGAHPLVPDFPGAEHGITSNEVFHLDDVPKRVLIAFKGTMATAT